MKRATTAAFLASAVGHAIIALVLIVGRRSAHGLSPDATPIEVELLPTPPEPAAPPSSDGTEEKATAAVLARVLPSRETPPSSAPPEPAALGSAAPADSGSWSFSPTTRPALGAWPYHVSAIPGEAQSAPSATSASLASEDVETPARKLDRIMGDELDAHDRAIGLGKGGALIAAAHDAASPSIAPDEGSATLEIESDPTGKVLSARVVVASGARAGWNDVAQELIRLMAAKPLRPAHDDRHHWTRLRIVAERVLPSGGAYGRAPGAGSEADCTGSGAGRKCATGMPAGAQQSFDLSDIGARPARIVHVEIVGESSR